MRRKRLTILLAGLAALLVTAIGVAWKTATSPAQVLWFPDHSMLALEGVSYGQRHRVLHGTWWQKPFLALLPDTLRQPFERRFGGAAVTYMSSRPDTLVVWIHRRGSAPGVVSGWAFRNRRTVVFDEHGHEYETGGRGRTIFLPSSAGDLAAMEVPVFPRRGKTLGVRIYQLAPDGQWARVASCVLPNPAAGPYPTWTPQPLPISKREARLVWTLTELTAGLPNEAVPRRARSREAAWTRATFRITHPDARPAAWEPVGVTISDATGNVWTPRASFAAGQSGMAQLYFVGAPWAEEAAWDLRVEFARTGGWDPADVWTVQGIPVPGLGGHTSTRQSATKHGITVQRVGLFVPPRSAPTAGWRKGVPRVHLLTSRPLDGLRLTLVRAVNERGEAVPTSGLVQTHTDREYEANLRPPPGTKSLDLTFALHRTHAVTFRAQPPRQ